MGTDLIILARTDALSAKLIDNNCDPVDHPFILGRTPDGKEITFPNAGVEAIKKTFTGAQVQ
jgi:isocitrate lyase